MIQNLFLSFCLNFALIKEIVEDCCFLLCSLCIDAERHLLNGEAQAVGWLPWNLNYFSQISVSLMYY